MEPSSGRLTRCGPLLEALESRILLSAGSGTDEARGVIGPGWLASTEAQDPQSNNSPLSESDPLAASSPLFTDIVAGLPGVRYCCLAWGDYDSDGDLDLALAGDTGSGYISRIYRNDGGVFTDIVANLPGVSSCALAWGDYDSDGDLDLALAGDTGSARVSRIYRNDGGVFTDIVANLPGVSSCALAWGDYDNDGDLDLVLAGYTGSGRISTLFRNNAGVFAALSAGLPGVSACSLAWGDYDNDGDLDLALAGYTSSIYISRIYRNSGGAFTDVGAGLPGVWGGTVAWGDYDNDGDLDLALAGRTSTGSMSRIYRNDGGVFTDIAAGLPGVRYCSLAWADHDNDGDLDLVLAGSTSAGDCISRIYRNDAGVFTDIAAGLAGVKYGSLAWGDYDNDGDLDLALAGWPGIGYLSCIYRNDAGVFNAPPVAPTGLSEELDSRGATLSWSTASDAQTPSAGLSYNVRVGTSPGAGDVFSGMADALTGLRRLPGLGNVQQNLSWKVSGLTIGVCYYWSVQAVDPSWAGSQWAPERRFMFTGFTDVEAGLLGLGRSSLAWGDYDNDGDLDLALAGVVPSHGPISLIYRNDGGSFTDIAANLPGVSDCSLAWGDYDNDGDLDLALAGDAWLEGSISRICRNDGGVFTDIVAGLPGVHSCSLAWGDYDNDGDLDLALEGWSGLRSISVIYRNDNGAFTDIQAGLQGYQNTTLAWGDYDNDGDLDLALDDDIYRNDGGTFTDIQAGLVGVGYSSLAWGDYDNDGDLDLALAGAGGPLYARIYRNDGGVFTDIVAGLPGVKYCSLAWGDYDNDGDLDLALAGKPEGGIPPGITRIYRNDEGVFTDTAAGLPGVWGGTVAWGDYDHDGNLELALTGSGVSRIYRYEDEVLNTPPAAPTGLAVSMSGTNVTLSWPAAFDAQTPSAGLSYNIRIGTSPGADDVFSGMADASTGLRRLPGLGNVQQNLSWTMSDLPVGTYYWSVQAVDSAWGGSPWATEKSFPVGAVVAAVVGRHVFCNNSSLDDESQGRGDDDAIAADKQALVYPAAASAANCTSYSRGINGIMVDIVGLAEPDELSVETVGEYFRFRAGGGGDPSSWAAAPMPQEVAVRVADGEGGSARVSLIWADGDIAGCWLEVTVLSDAHGGRAGLAEDDVFYFGNLPGDADGDGTVDAFDYLALKRQFGSEAGLPVSGADFDGSGQVDRADLLTLVGSFGQSLCLGWTAPEPAGGVEPTAPVGVQSMAQGPVEPVESPTATMAEAAEGAAMVEMQEAVTDEPGPGRGPLMPTGEARGPDRPPAPRADRLSAGVPAGGAAKVGYFGLPRLGPAAIASERAIGHVRLGDLAHAAELHGAIRLTDALGAAVPSRFVGEAEPIQDVVRGLDPIDDVLLELRTRRLWQSVLVADLSAPR